MDLGLTPELRDWLEARVWHLAQAAPAFGREQLDALAPMLLASDFAFERLRGEPKSLPEILAPDATLELPTGAEGQWSQRLRRFRRQHSLALIAQDLAGAPVETILQGSSWLAAHCTQAALEAASAALASRHGLPADARGQVQALVVFGLGKLGGFELNFSSDIDLVFAYPETGQTLGTRSIENETFFLRLGQRLIQLLDEVTADGFGFRVDMRLRPFGSVGRLALSFSAMENYFQREGRDWERYAWIKARPIAGDIAAGETLIATLRPFVYRRYLDYNAFDGLREMKAMIEAEVQRRDLAEHLKLGPGGIREIEFIVQLQQMVRGGREPALRARGLREALAAASALGHIAAEAAERLLAAYRFLRRLENRLQMLRDEQVHELPEDVLTRSRLAYGLGFPDWDALYIALEGHRALVRTEFMRVFEARTQRTVGESEAFKRYWRDIDRDAGAAALAAAGMPEAEAAHERLRATARSPGVRALAAAARELLDRVLPELLAEAARNPRAAIVLPRLLDLLHAILRRSSYLALLDEQPVALKRVVDVMARSALLAQRLTAHPLLLDDLLDVRGQSEVPDFHGMQRALATALRSGDLETSLSAANEVRHSIAFRIALATLAQRHPAAACAKGLAELAAAVVGAMLPLAVAEVVRSHGRLPGQADDAGLGIVGYGSLGGFEFGFGSDLDLVFLFDEKHDADSDGARPLDALRYRQRVVQKLISMLEALTASGRLYQVDVRLRPDGAKGLLLSSLRHFEAYQRERAWVWEHQALVRARGLAGDAEVLRRFAALRFAVLTLEREPSALRSEILSMRQRMRAELDRSTPFQFDLKQGDGGLVDLEFVLQCGVLERARASPRLCESTATPELIVALGEDGWLATNQCTLAMKAHAVLLERSLDCSLDARPRLAAVDAALEDARGIVRSSFDALRGIANPARG